MKKPLLSIGLATSLTFALSGCSFVEDLLPQEEQRTIDVFDSEPSGTFEGNNPLNSDNPDSDLQDALPTDQGGIEPSSPEPTPEPEPAPDPEPVDISFTVSTVGETFDYLEEIDAITSNTCSVESLLGSTTEVRVSNVETPTPPYSILYIPVTEADKPDIRAIAYYPTVPNNLNPELLTDYQPQSCELNDLYVQTLTAALEGDKPLSDPAPTGIELRKAGNTYQIELDDVLYTHTVAGNIIVKTEVITDEETITRTITHQTSEADHQLFESLAKFLRTRS